MSAQEKPPWPSYKTMFLLQSYKRGNTLLLHMHGYILKICNEFNFLLQFRKFAKIYINILLITCDIFYSSGMDEK